MYLIVGLGNPEKEYENTRHNMGFNVINEIAKKYNIDVNKTNFRALIGQGLVGGKKTILLKPQTFMNLSGESIIECINFYKIDIENVIIVYDDIDIEEGHIRIRKQGTAGTHNGMKSVINHLKTIDLKRVRIGIGRGMENENLVKYVIGPIPESEKKILNEGVLKGRDSVVSIIEDGMDFAMNKYNV